ncbi:MAG: hypothetical protein AABW99_02830 [archaeon]
MKEMSLKINTEDYDSAEETHPFYREMVQEMLAQLKKRKIKRVLELGAGTGLFTKKLREIKGIEIDALEISSQMFFKLFSCHLQIFFDYLKKQPAVDFIP